MSNQHDDREALKRGRDWQQLPKDDDLPLRAAVLASKDIGLKDKVHFASKGSCFGMTIVYKGHTIYVWSNNGRWAFEIILMHEWIPKDMEQYIHAYIAIDDGITPIKRYIQDGTVHCQIWERKHQINPPALESLLNELGETAIITEHEVNRIVNGDPSEAVLKVFEENGIIFTRSDDQQSST